MTVPPAAGPGLPDSIRVALADCGLLLEREVGRGGMAVVWRALDRKHDRPLAVKLLRPDVSRSLAVERFLREIQLAAALRHPNIVPIYDSGSAGETLYYTMPLVEGASLRDRLAHAGRLPVEEALQIGRQVADALAYAHARGVVHRDIKPENILLETGHAAVTDFGVALAMTRAARERAGGQSDEDRLAIGGLVVGTPEYMSPEQASGETTLDGRSDIFSLGCVLYEMVVGEPPFAGATSQAVMARRFLDTPVPVRQLRPEVPEAAAGAIARALSVDPADRFTTATDLARALAIPAPAPRASPFRRAARFLAAVLLLGLASVLTLRLGTRRRARLDPRRVVVAVLSNETGDTTLTPLGHMVAAWITDRLAGDGVVEVVTSATVVPAHYDAHLADSALDDPARVRRLADETKAGTIVSGSYYRAGRDLEFHVEITDANTGQLLRAFGPVLSRGRSEHTADTLSRAVTAAVDSLLGSRHGRADRGSGHR